MFPHPWVVKTIRKESFSPLVQTAESVSLSLDHLLLLDDGVIAQEPIFWFSTSTRVRKAIRIVPRRTALLLRSLRLISDDVEWNPEQCSAMLSGQIGGAGEFFLHLVESLRVCLCVFVWLNAPFGGDILVAKGLHNRKIQSIVSSFRIFSSSSLALSLLLYALPSTNFLN